MKKLISQLVIAASIAAPFTVSAQTPAHADDPSCSSGVVMFFYLAQGTESLINAAAACDLTTNDDTLFLYPAGASSVQARLIAGKYGKTYSWAIYHPGKFNPTDGSGTLQGGGEITLVAPAAGYTVPLKQTQRAEASVLGNPAGSDGDTVDTPEVALDPTRVSVSAWYRDATDGYSHVGRATYNAV